MTTHAGFAAPSTASSPTSDGPRPPQSPAVTVVVCAYTEQRWPQIVRALDSVRAQRTPAERVVLVVDHNPALLERAVAAFPDVTVVPNTGPRGLSGARNTGMAYARTEVVAFLDDDAEARADWLTRLIRHYADPDVVAVGGPAEPAWEGSRPRWLPPEFDWVVGCSFVGQPTEVAPVRNLLGCNMSFRREALERAGSFDSALGRVGKVPIGCEETELCIRLRQRCPGGVVLYDPGAAVRHRVTADRATWRYFRRRCYAEGRSKAVVARLAGTRAALSAEQEYTRRTLPRGVLRELRAHDAAGPLRAGSIVAGLAVTATGYLLARARRVTDAGHDGERGRGRHRGRPEPVRVVAVELTDGVPALSDRGRSDGGRHSAARVLIRLHGQPLGLLQVDLPVGGLTAEAHAELIARELSWEIDDHLQRDGLSPVRELPAAGIGKGVACAALRGANPSPFTTVVVPTCGNAALLRRCLASMTTLDYPAYEVVVVDNRPERSGTAELVARFASGTTPVRYASEPRHGVTHARNRGLAQARGEIVVFADDDVIVDRQWLRALVDGFTDDAIGAVTGHVLAGELETPAQVWVERYGGFGKGCVRYRFDATGYEAVERGQPHRVAAAPHLLYPYLPGTYGTGANMAFRTRVLRELGGFDPVLSTPDAVPCGGDIDVLLRVVLAGHALAYEPSAIVWHAHKRELPALRRTIYGYGVGLGAVMAKCLLTADRARRRDLMRRLPHGIAYALYPNSAKNAGKRDGYPTSLTALEMCGMALGLAYYARAAWASRWEGARS